jgi:hypothetical protein
VASRALFHNFKAVGCQLQKYGLSDARALFGMNPLVVQIWKAIAIEVLDKRFVDGAESRYLLLRLTCSLLLYTDRITACGSQGGQRGTKAPRPRSRVAVLAPLIHISTHLHTSPQQRISDEA